MGVLSTSKEIEHFKISQDIKNPIFQFSKFQFSKIPKKQKNQKNKKTNSAQTMGGRGGEAKSWHNCFFFLFFLFFFENWNFGNCLGGRGGLRQNRILSVAQKSIETQYKYRNNIQTK